MEIFGIAKRLKKNHDKTEFSRELVTSLEQQYSEALHAASCGEAALSLFFAQILHRDVWVLDFRSDSFNGDGGKWTWAPRPFYFGFSSEFLKGIRCLYRGFYLGDDALFTEALESLQLSEAGESLRKHFGQGDQTSVSFSLKVFQNTFAEVFDACARAKIKLHPEFFVLGIALLSLYENLENSGERFDVRRCFLWAESKST